MVNPHILPTINACLNGIAAILLFSGWRAIKRGDRKTHQSIMVAALVTSVLFLISYVTYHAIMKGVVTHYQGVGALRYIYFSILIPHTILAMIVVPLCIAAVYQAYRKNFSAHTKITRWLLPVWMYVSVTGVVIYLMLYIF